MTGAELIAQAVDAVDFGQPKAAKRGNNPAWPYVPVIMHAGTPASPRPWQEQLPAVAFTTAAAAVEYGERTIAARRNSLAAHERRGPLCPRRGARRGRPRAGYRHVGDSGRLGDDRRQAEPEPMFETIAEFAFAVEVAAGAATGRLFA